MNNRIFFALFTGAFLLLASCKKDESPPKPPAPTWLGTLSQVSGYSLFTEAIAKCGLQNEITSGNFTVLAPNDSVFQNYLSQLGTPDLNAWISTFGLDHTNDILRYHFIQGKGMDTSQFTNSYIQSYSINQFGYPLSLRTEWHGNNVMVNDFAEIIGEVLQVNQTSVLEVDQVLLIPSVLDIVSKDPAFSLLRQSLTRSGGSLRALLRQDNEHFTLFAPTNRGITDFIADQSAFSDFSSFLQYYTPVEMSEVLQHHMLKKVVSSAELQNGGQYTTRLPGYSLTVIKDSLGNTLMQGANGSAANVIFTDIHTFNGVVHSIDYLLFPL